jgi:hypothetical protein
MTDTQGGPGSAPVTINCTEIDGVPVFWPDTPMPGPRVGALQFYVGRAHEPAAMGGITHLVEHLVLAPIAQQEYGHNGFVAGWRTVLHAEGSDNELVDYFGRVTAGLQALPLDRLTMERRILRQESASRNPGIVARLLWFRFGHAGHGLVATEELGLTWLGPDHVDDWARTRFVRQNAAAWFSGPPPAGLRFNLPDGTPPPGIPLDPVDGVRFPAHMTWQADGVSIGYLVERSAAAVVSVNAAARKARDVLRFERGLVYDVNLDYEPLDGRLAHGYIGADSQAADTGTVRDVLQDVLESIARDGLPAEDIRREVRQYRDSLLHPQAVLGHLDAAAAGHLTGRPREDPAAITADYEAITAEATAASTTAALDSLLLAAPGPPPEGRNLSTYPTWSTSAVGGQTVRAAGWPLRNRKRKDRLTVGEDGVSWDSGDGGKLTVRYADCVAYVHWQDASRQDARREIRGRDGFAVRLVPGDWANGAELVRRVDAAVPPGVIACGEHGIGGMADPADQSRWSAASREPYRRST